MFVPFVLGLAINIIAWVRETDRLPRFQHEVMPRVKMVVMLNLGLAGRAFRHMLPKPVKRLVSTFDDSIRLGDMFAYLGRWEEHS